MHLALPEIILACGTCGLLFVGLFLPKKEVIISFLSCILIGITLIFLCKTPYITGSAFHDLFRVTPLITFLKVLLLVFGGSALLVSWRPRTGEDTHGFEYPLLILFSLLGMMLALSSGDLLSLFMGLELQGICLYVMVMIRQKDTRTAEAGVKYFILGTLATTVLLFGISLIYGFTGTTNFHLLKQILAGQSPTLGCWIGFVFFIAGLAFKIPLTPFHMWAPDIYEGTPTSITTFLAIVPKIATLGLLLCLFTGPFSLLLSPGYKVLSALAIASMIFSAFAALNQKSIKRLLGYSSIGHMGYALIGIICGSKTGGQATLVYLLLYALMTLGVFACLLKSEIMGKPLETVNDIKGLIQIHPGLALTLIFLLLSMTGIPPLAGFFGKLYLFQAAIAKGYLVLALTGAITSVIAAAYYFQLIKAIAMDNPPEGHKFSDLVPHDQLTSLLIIGIILILIVFSFNPSLLLNWTQWAVEGIM